MLRVWGTLSLSLNFLISSLTIYVDGRPANPYHFETGIASLKLVISFLDVFATAAGSDRVGVDSSQCVEPVKGTGTVYNRIAGTDFIGEGK
jgi:hypothetical protein